MKTDKNQTLEELVKEFLEYLEVERNLSRLTIRNYAIYLRRLTMWLADEFPEVQTVEKLDLKTVRAYRLFLSRLVDDMGKPLKKITQNYYVITLRSFLKWLIKNDYKVLAPEKIELPKQDSRSLKFLTADQVNYLLAQPYLSTEIDLRDKAILEVLFSTGLRVSELVSLDCEQINFKTREFGIIGKGRRHRIVFLSPRAVKWLLRYLEERTDDYSPLFIRYSRGEDAEKDGEKMRLTPRSVQRIVKKYVKRAKLSVDATTHTLRHSFATDLLTHGADLRSVQELLGHKNVATTQVYTHVTNARLRSVHEKFHGKEAED